MQRIDKIFIFF